MPIREIDSIESFPKRRDVLIMKSQDRGKIIQNLDKPLRHHIKPRSQTEAGAHIKRAVPQAGISLMRIQQLI